MKFFKKSYLMTAFLVVTVFGVSALTANAGLNTTMNIPTNYRNLGVTAGIVAVGENAYWYADPSGARIVRVNGGGTITRTVGRLGNGEGEFNNPLGITVDNTGLIYVADSDNHRIQVLDSNGGFLFSWGVQGTNDGEFDYPTDVKYDAFSNSIFVVDQRHNQVQKFTKLGAFVGKFGTFGAGNGEFNEPTGLDTDSSGRIYVVDTNNHRVQVFNSNLTYNSQFGSEGFDPNQFLFPKHVAIMSNGNIVVTSQNSNDIKIFSSTWTHIRTIAGADITGGQLALPYGVSVTASNAIFVTDIDYSSIHKFDASGNYISSVRNNSSANGYLSFPLDISFDSNGDIYVLQRIDFDEIVKYDTSGNFIEKIVLPTLDAWFMEISSDDEIYVTNDNGEVWIYELDGTFIDSFGSRGTDPDQFTGVARGIAFDSLGNIYVSDSDGHEIKVFNSSRVYQYSFGSFGSADGQLNFPQGLAIDSNDNLYVADEGNGRIQKFDTLGNHIDTFGTGMFARVYDIAIDTLDNVWVADTNGSTLYYFDENGTLIESFGGYGTGPNQFRNASGIYASHVQGEIWAVDVFNHRVQKISTGTRIMNLISSADVLKTTDLTSLVYRTHDPLLPGNEAIESEMFFGDYIVSDFEVDLTDDRDWDAVMATTIPSASKSLLVNINPVDAPGVSATHSIYIPMTPEQDRVYICPNASTLYEVTRSCVGGYELEVGDPNLSIVEINGVDYWKIDGLTGTGALGYSITPPAVGMVLTPDNSMVGNTQEVVISYTPVGGFVASDRIQFHFEIGGFVLANTCGTPTTDANGDSTADGSASIVGGDTYEYTFTDDVTAGALEFCVNVTAPLTEGSYSVRLTDDNGNFDSAMYYVGDDNNVFVIANVMPSLSFNIRTLADDADTNVCNFGTVSSSTPIPDYNDQADIASECGYSLAVGTNAVGGFQTQIVADGPLNGAGGSIADLSNGGSFTAGVEAYGIASITPSTSGRNPLGGLYTESILRSGNFDLAANTGTSIPTTIQTMITYNNGVQYVAGVDNVDVTRVVHGIVIGSGTPAGYYDQVITYTTTANF